MFMPKDVAAVHLSLNGTRPVRLPNKLQQTTTLNKPQTQLKRRLRSKFKMARNELRDSQLEVRTSLNSSILAPSSVLAYPSQPLVLYQPIHAYNSIE